MTSASDRFWMHPELREMFPAFLIQLHRVMQGGITLMRLTKDRAVSLSSDDEASLLTANYLATHIEEEIDHDNWLLADIETLGIPAIDVTRTTPLTSVVSLLGAQYFWALQMHPVAVFGYLIVLEGYPPLAEQLEEIRTRTRLPQTAFRCLHAHADNDPHHIADLNRTLDNMPLTREQEQLIALSAFHTVDMVAAIFEEIIEQHNACRTPSQMLSSYA